MSNRVFFNAEAVRFELTDRLLSLLFSRQVPSTTQPRLRACFLFTFVCFAICAACNLLIFEKVARLEFDHKEKVNDFDNAQG